MVAPASGNLSFDLPAPTPIYGSVNVASTPMGAQIKIDGKTEGVTPLLVSNVLVGKHTVELLAAGKQPFTASVDVRENEIAELNAELKQASEGSVGGNLKGSSTPNEPTAPCIPLTTEPLHRVETFEELPDFIKKPLGYNGGWNFKNEKATKKAVLNYFSTVDSSLRNHSKEIWSFYSQKSYHQSIAGYDFEFYFISVNKKNLSIWYKTSDKCIYEGVQKALSPLWLGYPADTILGICGHVNIRFYENPDSFNVIFEYTF